MLCVTAIGGCRDHRHFYVELHEMFVNPEQIIPCVSKQCPADGVWRIGRGGPPDKVLKTACPLRELCWTRFTPSESTYTVSSEWCPEGAVRVCFQTRSAGHGY